MIFFSKVVVAKRSFFDSLSLSLSLRSIDRKKGKKFFSFRELRLSLLSFLAAADPISSLLLDCNPFSSQQFLAG